MAAEGDREGEKKDDWGDAKTNMRVWVVREV